MDSMQGDVANLVTRMYPKQDKAQLKLGKALHYYAQMEIGNDRQLSVNDVADMGLMSGREEKPFVILPGLKGGQVCTGS